MLSCVDREVKSGMYKLSSKLRVSRYKCMLLIYCESESEYVTVVHAVYMW